MPRVYKYICNHCDYTFDIGTGDLIFVIDKEGKRTMGRSSWDFRTIEEIMRKSWNFNGEVTSDEYYALIKNKVGKIQMCVCLNCLELVYLVWDSEDRMCSKCKSTKVILIDDLVGKRCPNCDAGTVVKENFGISD